MFAEGIQGKNTLKPVNGFKLVAHLLKVVVVCYGESLGTLTQLSEDPFLIELSVLRQALGFSSSSPSPSSQQASCPPGVLLSSHSGLSSSDFRGSHACFPCLSA